MNFLGSRRGGGGAKGRAQKGGESMRGVHEHIMMCIHLDRIACHMQHGDSDRNVCMWASCGRESFGDSEQGTITTAKKKQDSLHTASLQDKLMPYQ